MVTRLVVNEPAVDAARVALLDASLVLSGRALRAPVESVQTLGSAGADLGTFVRGLDTARSALGDSAKACSTQLAALLLATDELDQFACYVPEAPGSGSSGSESR